MLGTLQVTEDGRFALRFDRRYAHPPEKVWRALTDPDQLRDWFPAVVSFDLTPGAKLRFEFPGGRAPTGEGEVIRADPPYLLEYTWDTEILRWELTAEGDGGCRLVFTNIFDDRDTAVPAGAGWHAGLEVMAAIVAGREVDWSAWDRADELHGEYVRRFA